MALPPICSASLNSITMQYGLTGTHAPQPVTLTSLPGCTQLRDVRVVVLHTPNNGAFVKIHCHCDSERCIVPVAGCAGVGFVEAPWGWRAGVRVGVRLLPAPASPQGVQPYTVIFTGHATGPGHALKLGHIVMAGLL